jgi:hypothetical protein
MDVTMPDGTVIQGVPEGTTKAQIAAKYSAHLRGSSGQQPTVIDRIVGSPVGRLIHDAVVQPLAGAADLMTKAQLMGSGIPADKITPGSNIVEQPYQAALAANRNTPGYATARAKADKVAAAKGSGLSDQLLAPYMPAIAGTVGGLFGGSLDAANASADAQTAAQNAYATQHPIASTAAQLAGGFMAGPEMAKLPGKIPTPLIQPLGDVTPAQAMQAQKYVYGLASSSGKSPADLTRAVVDASGKPITAAEAIGKPGTVGLAALGRRNGETGDALTGLLDERATGAPGRVMADYAAASGVDPHAAQGNIEALVAEGRQKAAPLYQQAYQQPPAITDRLAQFANEPIVQQGMKTGIKIQRLKALEEGRPFDPNAYGITSFDAAGDPVIGPVPTWQTWDAGKVGLDNMLDQYRDKVTGRVVLDKMGDAINGVRKAMVREVDAVNPAYKAARAQAGDYLSASSAFQWAQKAILDPNATAAQFSKMLQSAEPAELEAMKGGVANKLFNLAQNDRLDPKVFNRPVVRQKLSALLGQPNAETLLRNVKIEADMAAAARLMKPGNGSGTAGWQAAMAEQDGASGVGDIAMNTVGNVAAHGVRGGLAKTAGQYLVTKPLDYLRTRGMSLPVRDEAGRMLMLSPSDFAGRAAAGFPPSTGLLGKPSLTLQSRIPYGLFGSMGMLQSQHQ